MKLTCQRNDLLSAANLAATAVLTGAADAVLAHFLLKAENPSLTIVGYDVKTALICEVDAAVSENGGILVNARSFAEIIRKLPDEPVFISTEGNNVIIRSSITEFSLSALDESQYPELPSVSEENKIVMTHGEMRKIINRTVFAALQLDTDETYTGVLFEIKNDLLKAVALDKYRLAVTSAKPVSIEKGEINSFIVPVKALTKLVKAFDGPDDELVTIYIKEKQIMFKTGNITLIARLLSGAFLNYENSIPKEFKTTFVIDRKRVIEAVERAAILLSKEKQKPVLRITFDGPVMKITSSTREGKFYDEVSIPENDIFLEMGFNDRFLYDAFSNAEGEKVKVSLCAALSPMIVTPVEGNDYLYLVLPARLK